MKNKPKIIVFSMYFDPDHSGIALYSTGFVNHLVENDYDVHVITGFPFYPNWTKRKKDKYKLFQKKTEKGAKVYRGYTYVPSKVSTVGRLIQEFLLNLFSVFNFIRAGRPDIIVTFTTPVSFGFTASIFAALYRCKSVINVQDFQVEAASSLNMVKGGVFIKILKKVEVLSYKWSDMVCSISYSMMDLLREKNVQENKLYYWPNWIDINKFRAQKINQDESFRIKNNIDSDKKIIGYAGNIGLKQGLEILVDVAQKLEEREDVVFYIVGEGSGLINLKKYAENSHVNNLHFLPFLKPDAYSNFLDEIDFVFISQLKTETDIYFPSKLLGILAKGKNILLAADQNSELFKVLDQNQVAIVSPYEKLEMLIENVENALLDEQQNLLISERAKSFVRQFDEEEVLNKVLNKIIEL